ncbi:uncharacterized protein ppp1r18 [Oncorhynchus nerka]|uniref:uncharacterized protein ppp1r18 n=1 Tax=Oncorhynchus nerka TaxID=8023 RepID=UPI00113007B6|nr:uncharacterized protein LOC115131744 [Oncorhynchus nerka]
MSVSSLPEWKQLLLERKRREEEEREKREKEEEAKLASMPVWKRGIIQRRRMKQESFGDKEREGPLQVKEGRSPSDAVSDPDSATLVQLGSESPLSPDVTGPWLDEESKPQSQVLRETITPVQQNPFIRTHGGLRRGREEEMAGEMGHEKGNEQEIEVGREREKEKERGHVKGHDGESGMGRDIELKLQRYRERSRGRERDRSAGRETSRDTVRDREREYPRGRKEEEREEGDSDPQNPKYPHPLVPGLRTIRADNIIIIEQDRKGSDERRGRRREWEREVMEEEQEKRDVKMDLKEFISGGGSVTEIRASEVLVIKPLAGTEDCRSGSLKGAGREGDGKEKGEREAKCNKDGRKDCERGLEREVAWLMMKDKERENLREKDRPRTHTASEQEDRRCGDTDDSIHNERRVRVSELLSKFGEHTKKFREHPKPPSRSKSSDCFSRPGRDRDNFGLDEDDDGDRRGEEKRAGFRGVPKRSFSFSDQVICTKENGMQDEGNHDRKVVERTCSDRRVAPRGDVVEGEWSERGGKQGGWTRFSDKERVGKHREEFIKTEREEEGQPERQPALESNTGKETDHGVEIVTRVELEYRNTGTEELTQNRCEEAGFTRASVKNTEASFAQGVPIKHDGRERAVEREVKRMTEERERGMERARSTEREVVVGRQAEPQVRDRRGSEAIRRGSDARDAKRMSEVRDCTMSVETTQQNCVITLSVDRASPPQSVESHYRRVSALTECSTTLLSAVAHRGTDWRSSQGAPGNHSTQLALSQHTGEFINKTGRIGETANELDNHKGTQSLTQDRKRVTREDTENVRGSKAYRVPSEVSKESAHSPGTHVHSHVCPEMPIQEVTPESPKSPKHVASVGIPPTPLERHIPRTVFYGVGEVLENKRPSLQSDDDQSCEGEGGKGVERRDSWRIGKPLSRIESLREKIRQREKERLKDTEGAVATGDDGDATEGMKRAGTRRVRRASSSDRCDEGERGNEMGRERQRQEGSAQQTTSTQFYVTQEASVSKADPELPVPLSFSQSVKGEEESDHTIEREEDPIKHVVDELRCDRGRQRKQDTRGRGGEVAEDKLSEEEDRLHYLPPSPSPSPSDSFSPSLAEMSRIYNLKTVGSRTAVCMSERTVDRPIPIHTPNVQSRISAEQQEPSSLERSVGMLTQKQLWGGGGASGNKASCDENSELQKIQRQVEQLQLREQQEVQRLSHDDNAAQSTFSKKTNLKAKESVAQQSTRISHNQPNKEPQQMHPRQKDQQTPLNPRKCQSNPQLHSERPPQSNRARSITINSRSLLTPSPENSLHPDQGVPPSTSSSPCSPSPPQSPSVSPSPSPSPIHFTIRTGSGGQQAKRGTTITITPRKPVGGAAVESVSVSSGPSVKTSTKSQMPVLTEIVERGKKRYPTTEEIEVIGGYQNLDKSCLVKTPKGTPKGVKVCFDETQLEQVFEYPSEASMIAFTPYPIPGQEKGKEDEVQEEEEEEERGVFVSGSSRNVGAAAGLRVLRIDESCHR